ncbi:MAG: hypothetical protein QMD46_05395 [Methanomicrobiales archaeon]|nr:hypothetical protein [Methanomicrobiales archaeon]MDI6875578.1 hypothetical protein [Methanomicrobiales archaeon]
MEAYAGGIVGEIQFSRQERGYYVELFDASGRKRGRTGYYISEAKAREAARKLAVTLARES